MEEEFAMTRKATGTHSPILAQHLIQSFAEGEIDPATAHKIGLELADRFTDLKHEYIVATHLDRGHIHNHIIFNHIDFVDHKCFHCDGKKMRLLRSINDEICTDHGLSVITSPGKKGKPYHKWAMEKFGTVDADHRKTATGKNGTPDIVYKPYYIRVWKYDQELGLIENTGNYLLFIKSNYGRQRAAIQDAKKIAATYNLLKENNIDSLSDLSEAIENTKKTIKDTRENIRDTESEIADINDTLKYLGRVNEYRGTYREYIRSGKSKSFSEAHRMDIMLYESAIQTLKLKGIDIKSTHMPALKKRLHELEDKRIDLSTDLEDAQSKRDDLLTAQKNVEAIIKDGTKPEKNVATQRHKSYIIT